HGLFGLSGFRPDPGKLAWFFGLPTLVPFMVFLACPIPGRAARKVANFPGSAPWFFWPILGNRPDPFMVFLARPEGSRQLGFLPTFGRSAGPVPGIFANFSADLEGASTANLEKFKSRVV